MARETHLRKCLSIVTINVAADLRDVRIQMLRNCQVGAGSMSVSRRLRRIAYTLSNVNNSKPLRSKNQRTVSRANTRVPKDSAVCPDCDATTSCIRQPSQGPGLSAQLFVHPPRDRLRLLLVGEGDVSPALFSRERHLSFRQNVY